MFLAVLFSMATQRFHPGSPEPYEGVSFILARALNMRMLLKRFGEFSLGWVTCFYPALCADCCNPRFRRQWGGDRARAESPPLRSARSKHTDVSSDHISTQHLEWLVKLKHVWSEGRSLRRRYQKVVFHIIEMLWFMWSLEYVHRILLRILMILFWFRKDSKSLVIIG